MTSKVLRNTAVPAGKMDAGAAGDSAKPLLGNLATPRGSIKPPPRQITIDPNIGLPSIEPHADEPYGIWYTVRKSIRGFWATRETEDTTTNRELYIRTTLRELFVYLMFLITTLVMTFGSTSPTMFYLTQALTSVFVTPFKEINKFDDLFTYYKGPLMEGLYWENWYNNDSIVEKDRIIYYANRVLGVPRMRQFRVTNKSCAIPLEFHEIIEECYGDFSHATESKDIFGNGSYGNDSAWFYREANETGMGSHWGKLASYDGGGYVQDLNLTKDISETLIKDLEKGRWLDQATRAVLVDFTVYNVNLNLFATIRLCTEVPPTGGLVQTSEIRTIKLLKYQTKRDYTVLAFECMFCMFIFYYIGEEVIEVSKLKVRYFKSFWNVLDISVLTCAVVCVGFSVNHYFLVHETLSGLLDIHDKYVDFEYLSFYQVMLTNSMAVTVFFAWIKLFKYLSFNKTMMQLSLTLGRAAKDIASFSIMFFIVFFAFAQLGFFLFGTQLDAFHDFGASCFTLLRTILGDFDFEKIQAANRVLGPIFFFMYIFFVFFVLLNMFLAIINETYSAVKEDLASKPNDFEITDYLKRGFNRVLRALHIRRLQRWQKKTSLKFFVEDKALKQKAQMELDKWEDDLKHRGYTDEEIVEVFGKTSASDPLHEGEDEEPKEAGPSENVAELERRVKKLEAALTAILGHFDSSLAKLEVMEKAKQSRDKKLDVIIDNLDGGKFHKQERKEELVREDQARQRRKKIPATRSDSTMTNVPKAPR